MLELCEIWLLLCQEVIGGIIVAGIVVTGLLIISAIYSDKE